MESAEGLVTPALSVSLGNLEMDGLLGAVNEPGSQGVGVGDPMFAPYEAASGDSDRKLIVKGA